MRREQIVERNLLDLIEGFTDTPPRADLDAPLTSRPIRSSSEMTGREFVRLFESQLTSRLLDLEARRLKNEGRGFYTISSAGHEGNVILGALLRLDDPCFLHYRSGALMMARAGKAPGETPIFDTLLSFCASAEDPISGGRHKVWGSSRLWVPPQTSTIASHLPKAVGMAFALERSRHLGLTPPIPEDAIICVTFGDATVNHAVARTAFNAARWANFQRLPLPILFVCEDNGIGISVRTPREWIERSFQGDRQIDYFFGDGLDLLHAYPAARDAVASCRQTRRPTFLHLRTVRLLGHAGSDVETSYLELPEIERMEAVDPLLQSARTILARGLLTPAEMLELHRSLHARIHAAAEEAAGRPHLRSAVEVRAPLELRDLGAVDAEARRTDFERARLEHYGGEQNLPENLDKPRNLSLWLNHALREMLVKYPDAVVFGEDVAKKGGVYGVTRGLAEAFGLARVFNTLLDETMILGLAIGAGHLGMIPVPEIQYLAYFHNAEDQIRGEAGSLQYFSKGAFRNPMVVRIASFAYQKGFGGHFHNDNSIAVLRDVPGLVIAAPSRGDDAVGMLRTCFAAARTEGAVCIFLEPIALYHVNDLHEDQDGGWLTRYPPPGESAPIGAVRVHPNGDEEHLTIVTFANGVHLSLQAARVLERDHGIRVRVVDVRWIAPLDLAAITREALRTGVCLVVDECRRTGGGIAEAVLAHFQETQQGNIKAARLTAEDTYVPLGPAAPLVSPSRESIIATVRDVLARARSMEGAHLA